MQLVHRWFDEIWTKGNLNAIDELLSPDAKIHGLGETDCGTESHQSFRDFVAGFRAAFSDIQIVVEQTVEEGDMVASRWVATMKSGDAREVKVTGMSMGRFRDGRWLKAGITGTRRD